MRFLSASDPQAIDAACRVLASGGTVVHATETCYGIACDLRNPAALQALFAVKRRPSSQPVSALFAERTQANQVLEISARAAALIAQYLPGPLTIVVPRKATIERSLLVTPEAQQPPTVGIRISSHSTAQALVERFGRPIATTSANVHGQANPYSPDDLRQQFSVSPLPNLVLDEGTLAPTPPSTVIEVIGDTLRVLRQGALTIPS